MKFTACFCPFSLGANLHFVHAKLYADMSRLLSRVGAQYAMMYLDTAQCIFTQVPADSNQIRSSVCAVMQNYSECAYI